MKEFFRSIISSRCDLTDEELTFIAGWIVSGHLDHTLAFHYSAAAHSPNIRPNIHTQVEFRREILKELSRTMGNPVIVFQYFQHYATVFHSIHTVRTRKATRSEVGIIKIVPGCARYFKIAYEGKYRCIAPIKRLNSYPSSTYLFCQRWIALSGRHWRICRSWLQALSSLLSCASDLQSPSC